MQTLAQFHQSGYNCVEGQTALGANYGDNNANSQEACEKKCDNNQECWAFDYTKNQQFDSCRLTVNGNDPRTDGGDHNRQYCSRTCWTCVCVCMCVYVLHTCVHAHVHVCVNVFVFFYTA